MYYVVIQYSELEKKGYKKIIRYVCSMYGFINTICFSSVYKFSNCTAEVTAELVSENGSSQRSSSLSSVFVLREEEVLLSHGGRGGGGGWVGVQERQTHSV